MGPPYFNISFEIISEDVLFPFVRDLIAALISCVGVLHSR
jgi:preprotein translocase subunit SecB